MGHNQSQPQNEETQGEHSLSLQISTDNPQQVFQRILKLLQLRDINQIGIDIQASSPITLSDVMNADPDDAGSDLGDETAEPTSDSEEVDETKPVTVDSTVEPAGSANGQVERKKPYGFHEDSTSFSVAITMYDRREEGFLETRQIQQFIPNDAGVPDEMVSGRLGALADAGLIEKKPHPSDGRKNVYKITSRGMQDVERAMEKFDSQPDPPERDEPPEVPSGK